MEQRRLRLGDILDDYCPRERRLTNHAVVAMIEEDVKQTRCTTCDAEHVYKGGKAPRRKKGDTTGALYKEVLAGITDTDQDAPVSPVVVAAIPAAADIDEPEVQEMVESEEMADIDDPQDELLDDDSQIHMLPPDEGPVHRPLIRAQLPRPEGLKIERQAPEFTIRQNNNGRGGGRHPRCGQALRLADLRALGAEADFGELLLPHRDLLLLVVQRLHQLAGQVVALGQCLLALAAGRT